ncbi:MAG TPA: sigma-54 dependent transcriptional regulator [Verrucomicrobiae bacterium]|jgi:DNA-binding NtrC family response regulator|nr:sigma-54 dependent transcriptional regulator [Verrucomicrobiae bacterium]
MSLYAKILIVDDEKNVRDGLRQFLEGLDYEVFCAGDGEEGFELYRREKPDLVLTDIRMPKMDGVSLLEKIKNENPGASVILLTAYGTVEDAVRAMKKGAYYYLTKPTNLEELELLVKKALLSQNLEEENRELKEALFKQKFETGEILARSQVMKDVLKTADQIAQSSATVLIEGESGTGKELIAHRIHQESNRSQQPFVAVHCAALTQSLLTSELFGHEKGAFTGAVDRKVGRFEKAHMGTLFLDEIGELSQETQVKLLRVLQEREFERVGSTKTIKVDVRLICATNKNLLEEVRAGRFREDLYYRINVIYLKMPPLRDRPEDIPALVEDFIKHFARLNGKKVSGIDAEALNYLKQYNWPGNVRELKNIVERMVVLTQEEQLRASLVPEDIRQKRAVTAAASMPSFAPGGNQQLQDMEREFIKAKLEESAGNKSLAAKKLGISRRTLYRKIEEYKL